MRKKEKQSSLIHQRIRKASFISYEEGKTETHKYKPLRKANVVFTRLLVDARRRINSQLQKAKRVVKIVDWEAAAKESSIWLIEVVLEGLTANFATHYLFNSPFNAATIFAHGIIIKQGLSIYWRLKTNGSDPKIPQQNKR